MSRNFFSIKCIQDFQILHCSEYAPIQNSCGGLALATVGSASIEGLFELKTKEGEEREAASFLLV